MKHKVYKTLIVALMAAGAQAYAQTPAKPAMPATPPAASKPAAPAKLVAPLAPMVKFNEKDLELKLKDIDVRVAEKMKLVDEQLSKIDFRKMDLAMADFDKKFAEQFQGFDQKFQKLDKLNDLDFQGDYQGVEKSKVITKSYNVDANDKLAINNQYGNVIISTWPKNEIKVDVQIKAYESSDSKAQDLLDGVTIIDSKEANLISFKTQIERNNSGGWSITRKNGKEERRGVQINYIISMPARNPLDITNRYGGITLPNFDGVVNINSSYGSFSGKSLSNSSNNIKVRYGSANIDNLKSGKLDLSYGSLKLGSAGSLNAEVSYSSANIGKLVGNSDIDTKYCGSFKIEEVDEDVKSLNVNSSYSSIALGFAPAASCNFDVTVSYAGFKFDDDKVKLTSTEPSENNRGFSMTKTYRGTYGKGSGTKVTIKSNYGGVRFL